MDLRLFTRRGKDVLRKALDYAAMYRHAYVGIEHCLLVFTAPDSDTAATKHAHLAIPCATIREIVSNKIQSGNSDGSRSIPHTPAVQQLLMDAVNIAESFGHIGVNPEHMFLALLNLDTEPLVRQICEHENADVDHLRRCLTTATEFDKYSPPIPPRIDG